jgi:4-hydroxy-tetrahydrodipicolinate synthase
MARFGAVLTAMITPFDDTGEVDLGGAAALARWLVEQGNDGLVVTGTTGEASMLTDDEQVAVWRAVREAVDVPVVAGSGTNDTRHAAELTGRAAGAGLDGVLVVTPYYNRPSQTGIEAHFRHVAGATDLLVHLARDVPNIVAVKDAAGDPAESARLVAQAPDGFELYSGDDSLTLPLLAVGAVGVIGVATHWAARPMGEMVAAFRKGDVDRARQLNAALIESYDFESGEATPNPLPAKAMMRALGRPAGQCRLPMGPAPDGLEARALEVHQRLQEA